MNFNFWRKSLREKAFCDSNRISLFAFFHRGLGFVYLFALFPLFFEITTLIGSNGLLPANDLLKIAYKDQGLFKSFMQYPSLYHFFSSDFTLYFLVSSGCIGALMLVFNYNIHLAALLSWISFISIITIGGDFFVIIIDLFLAEVGFLAIFSTYFLEKKKAAPNIIAFIFLLLNFRLWFCMGANKFYLPLEVWSEFTFFDYFFHAQPMPTPMAVIFNQAPQTLKHLAVISLFVAEIVVPFFVFGSKKYRLTALAVFIVTSVLIQLNGNYGYFNILSIVVALPILKDSDIPFLKTKKNPSTVTKTPSVISAILLLQISLQLLYFISVFNPTPHSPQNHFNYIFTNIKTENRLMNVLIEPLRWTDYWRICNPYGVFRGIPHFHGEIRFSGSYDEKDWESYEFKFLPSGNTDYLGFYAPYYPRLDHLMFYETLEAQNYRWNPLNKYYNESNTWICNFVNKLLKNDKKVSYLLKKNPFENQKPPLFIRAEIFRLQFSKEKNKNWFSQPMNIQKLYSKDNVCRKSIITYEEALFTTYSNEE